MKNKLKVHPKIYTKMKTLIDTTTNMTMCNNMIRLCLMCTNFTPNRGDSCPAFTEAMKNGAKYADMYDRVWLIEHMKEKPEKFQTQICLTFCSNCKSRKTPEFRPDITKVAEAAEVATDDLLGLFIFKDDDSERWVITYSLLCRLPIPTWLSMPLTRMPVYF